MNRLIFFCVLLAAAPTLACNSITWVADHRSYNVCYISKYHAFLSSSCSDSSCGAIALVNSKLDRHMMPGDRQLIKNPGAEICEQLGGEVAIAHDSTGDESAFCEATDHSVIDLSSLARNYKR